MFCIYCGATLPPDAEKCTICGNPVVLPPEPEKPAEEAAEPVIDMPAPAEPEPTETPEIPEPEDIFSGEPLGQETQVFSQDIYQSAAEERDPRGDYLDERLREQSGVSEERDLRGDSFDEQASEDERFRGQSLRAVPEERDLRGDYPASVVRTEYRDGYVYEEETPRKKRSFKWIFIVLPIVLAIGATVTAIALWYNAPVQQLIRALDALDYTAVAQTIPKLSEEERASLSTRMQAYAETVIERYNNGEAEYAPSYELLDRVQRMFPEAEINGAADRLAALKASKEAFAEGEKLEQKGEVAGAISRYGEVIRADINYDAAQKKIEEIQNAYKSQVLAEAQKRADEKDFLGAQAALMNSSAILGDDPDIAAKLEELQKAELDDYVESLLKTAKTLADDGDYPGAVKLLEDATKKDERFDRQIQIYKTNYKDKMLSEASKYAGASDFEEAVAVLEQSKTLLGDDAEIEAKIKEYKSLYPVRLVDLSPIGGADCASSWTATDISGNSYSNGLSFALYPILATRVSTEYAPGGKYKLFSGTWVVESDSTEDFIGTVRVYVDDELQYEVSSLTRASQTAELNLRIEGAQTVRIEAEGAFGSPRAAGYIYLAGATFRN